jgi:hypothetical protein
MSDANRSNGSALDTPHRNEPTKFENLTEAEFLAHEAELAKSAISTAFNDLKANLARAADVKLWAHHYPWLTMGVAAASGFTLAGVVKSGSSTAPDTQSDEESHREWLIREAAKAPYNSAAGEKKLKLGESVLGSLFSLARTALEASLVSSIRQQAQQPPACTPNGVGSGPAASPPVGSESVSKSS